jgi:hypothetical protein
MFNLLDTGILLRVFNRADPNCGDISHIVTLNHGDFARYPGIVAVSPAELVRQA